MLKFPPNAPRRADLDQTNLPTQNVEEPGILYVLWFSTKTDTPISAELLQSYFRAFNESAKKFQTDKLIDRNDPLRIGALSPETVSDARKMMLAGAYWDWVIAKSENKQDYRRYVEEFNRQLDSAK